MAERRYRALVIGNSEFPNDSAGHLARLNGPQNDVSALRDALVDPKCGLHQVDDVVVLRDSTKSEVEYEIDAFFRGGRRGDQLLFYYSGHGWPGRRGGLFFCVHDTDTERLRPTAVSKWFLSEAIEESPSRAIVVVLDCCHSGNFKGLVTPEDLDGEGRFVITSARPGQVAPDASDATRASPFTELIVEAMKDADIDEDGDGRITIDELFRHVKSGAQERGLPIPLRNSQHAVDSLAMAKRPRPRRKAGPATAQLGGVPEPEF